MEQQRHYPENKLFWAALHVDEKRHENTQTDRAAVTGRANMTSKLVQPTKWNGILHERLQAAEEVIGGVLLIYDWWKSDRKLFWTLL